MKIKCNYFKLLFKLKFRYSLRAMFKLKMTNIKIIIIALSNINIFKVQIKISN